MLPEEIKTKITSADYIQNGDVLRDIHESGIIYQNEELSQEMWEELIF